MTYSSICVSVAADLGIGAARAPFFQAVIPQSRRLAEQVRKAAFSLHRRCNWEELTREYTFTAAGNADFPLPPDYGWMVNDTAWEASRYWKMRGAMSPQDWRKYKNSIYGRATIWRRYRIRLPSAAAIGTASTFSVDPPIAAQDSTSHFVFEYVSKNWAIARDGVTPVADWTSDLDTPILDEYLIELGARWRMLRRIGLQYDEDKDEYEREVDKAVARNGGTSTLQLVPYQYRDFVGQYTLGAFPPVSPPAGPHQAATAGGQPLLLGQPPTSSAVLRPSGPPRRVIPYNPQSEC